MSHADSKDFELNLPVIEGLASLAKTQGCPDAATFLEGQWFDMQSILKKRCSEPALFDLKEPANGRN